MKDWSCKYVVVWGSELDLLVDMDATCSIPVLCSESNTPTRPTLKRREKMRRILLKDEDIPFLNAAVFRLSNVALGAMVLMLQNKSQIKLTDPYDTF